MFDAIVSSTNLSPEQVTFILGFAFGSAMAWAIAWAVTKGDE